MRVVVVPKSLWRSCHRGSRYLDIFSVSSFYDRLFRARRLTVALTVINFEVALILTFGGRP